MRRLEHNWHYQTFRLNQNMFMLSCVRYSDDSVVLLFLDVDGEIREYQDHEATPDCRQFYPYKFNDLPALTRCRVRAYLAADSRICKCGYCGGSATPARLTLVDNATPGTSCEG